VEGQRAFTLALFTKNHPDRTCRYSRRPNAVLRPHRRTPLRPGSELRGRIVSISRKCFDHNVCGKIRVQEGTGRLLAASLRDKAPGTVPPLNISNATPLFPSNTDLLVLLREATEAWRREPVLGTRARKVGKPGVGKLRRPRHMDGTAIEFIGSAKGEGDEDNGICCRARTIFSLAPRFFNLRLCESCPRHAYSCLLRARELRWLSA
jgi:hypothetical protein